MATTTGTANEKARYAALRADQLDDTHRALDAAIESVKSSFERTWPIFVEGRSIDTTDHFEDRSPVDRRILVGRFAKATPEQVDQAVAAARRAFPSWSARPWQDRVLLLRKLADGIHRHRSELAAIMGYEAGKNRLECLGDVEESADLIAYYCDQFEEHQGFVTPMGRISRNEENVSVLRPYGVWAIISPFNFPLALLAGPAGGALVSGNTVVFKPSSAAPLLGLKLYDLAVDAGLPPGVLNVVTGPGEVVGQAMADSPDVDGIVFTGSKDVGLRLLRENASRIVPRPMILELGGKNPALVMRSADMDRATDGVLRSAFSAQGQKCSACSRAYVAQGVKRAFLDLLVRKTKAIRIGNPLHRDVFVGPVIGEASLETYDRAIAQATRDGGTILAGGRRLTGGELEHGWFVEPTIIDGLPPDHPLFSEELFVPILLTSTIASLDEGIELANRTDYGLTAGLYSEVESEIGRFFDRVQAGVLYVNRRAGATTGAWPGINPFGGWKASGSTGRGSGGPWYVQQFLHEQSRVRVR